MSVTPLFGVQSLTSSRSGGVVHLAVSRSASVRLAPVMAALGELGIPQSVVDAPSGVDAALSGTRPAFALVAGDGEAAVAAAMATDRLGVPLARIGAGLRCDDRGIEAEINRIVLDELATRLYVDGDDAAERLQAEGFDHGRVVCAGSTLPDAIAGRPAGGSPLLAELGLIRGAYVLVTVHKPENVRDDARLRGIVEALSALAHRTAVVLCMHPVTAARMEATRAIRTLRAAGAIVRGAAAHPDFLALQASAGAVVTDSAGVQEETTVLGVPCFTIGRSTERALTLSHGTNVLLGEDPLEIADVPIGSLPEDLSEIPLWDGNAGRRIAVDLADWSGA